MRLLEPNRLFSMQGALRVYCLVWIPSAAGMSVWLLYLAVIARRFQIPNAEAVAGRGWRKCLWIAPAGLLLTASVSARHEMWWDDLGLLERQTARSIMKVWQVYEIEFPGATVTNLAQIFVNRDPSFGETMREKFLAYGLYGGCEDRFYDRYVFVAPGLKGRFTEGELLLIGARPYADGYNRELERIAITRAGTDYDALRCHELREAYVQQLFAEAGRPLPTPSSHRSTKGMPLHVRSVEALGIGAEWAGEFVFGFILLLGWGVWRCARSCFSLEPP
jgi:hypothetical protein